MIFFAIDGPTSSLSWLSVAFATPAREPKDSSNFLAVAGPMPGMNSRADFFAAFDLSFGEIRLRIGVPHRGWR